MSGAKLEKNKSQSMGSLGSGSMTSLHRMGLYYGHGYMAPKNKPEKPYGIQFKSRMNRTHRGRGGKFLWYAFACFWASLFWFSAGAVFLGHRNVSRVILYRTEVFGPLLVVGGILCIALMGHFCYKARLESNEWRSHIYYEPEGLLTAVAIHEIYMPDSGATLMTGTYSKKAIRVISGEKKKKNRRKSPYSRSAASSQQSLTSIKFYNEDKPPMYDNPSTASGSTYPVKQGISFSDTPTTTMTNQSYDPQSSRDPQFHRIPVKDNYLDQQPIRGGLYRASMNSPPRGPTAKQPTFESEL